MWIAEYSGGENKMNTKEKQEQDQSKIIEYCYYMWNNYSEEKLKCIFSKDYYYFVELMKKLENSK